MGGHLDFVYCPFAWWWELVSERNSIPQEELNTFVSLLILTKDFTGDGVDAETGRQKKNSKVRRQQRKKKVRNDENQFCLADYY